MSAQQCRRSPIRESSLNGAHRDRGFSRGHLHLSAILILASALRLYRLGAQDFWLDELLTLRISGLPFESMIRESFSTTVIPPLFYVPQFALSRLGLLDPLYFRLPAAIYGSLGSISVFLLGRELGGTARGLAAAFLLAVSPLHVWYSQDARPYTLLFLLSSLSFYTFLRMLRSPGVGWSLAFIGFTVLSLHTHTVSVFVCAAEALVALVWRAADRASFQRFAVASLAVAALCTPILLAFLKYFSTTPGIPRSSSLAALPYTLFAYSVGFSLGPSTRSLHSFAMSEDVIPHWLPLTLTFLVFGAIVADGLRRIAIDRGQLAPILSLGAVPILGTFFTSLFIHQTYNVRYTIPALVSFLLLLSLSLLHRRGWRAASAWLAILALDGWALANHFLSDDYAKENVGGAYQYVLANRKPQDRVIGLVHPVVSEFYGAREGLSIEVVSAQDETTPDKMKTVWRETARLKSNGWLVVSRPFDVDPNGAVREAIRQKFVVRGPIAKFAGVEIWICTPKGRGHGGAGLGP